MIEVENFYNNKLINAVLHFKEKNPGFTPVIWNKRKNQFIPITNKLLAIKSNVALGRIVGANSEIDIVAGFSVKNENYSKLQTVADLENHTCSTKQLSDIREMLNSGNGIFVPINEGTNRISRKTPVIKIDRLSKGERISLHSLQEVSTLLCEHPVDLRNLDCELVFSNGLIESFYARDLQVGDSVEKTYQHQAIYHLAYLILKASHPTTTKDPLIDLRLTTF